MSTPTGLSDENLKKLAAVYFGLSVYAGQKQRCGCGKIYYSCQNCCKIRNNIILNGRQILQLLSDIQDLVEIKNQFKEEQDRERIDGLVTIFMRIFNQPCD